MTKSEERLLDRSPSGEREAMPLGCPPQNSTELTWMHNIAQGDSVALTQLIQTYQNDIRTLIGRLTAWGSDVDDLTQEVFIKAWKNARHFRESTSLRNWLYTITVNHCRNHQRSLRRWWRTLHQFMEQKYHEQSPSRSALEHHDESWRELQLGLLQLTVKDRELLVLTYMEQRSSTEIARILSITENNYYVRLHRAKQRLAEVLNQSTER